MWLSPGGLGIRIPERGLGPLFSLVVVLLLRDNVLIGRVLSFGANLLVVVVPRGPGNIHAFNRSGRHLEFLIYDVIREKISAAIFEF